MNYPTISEYIESIRSAEDNFATLTDLRPVLDDEGNPVMSSGNFAVVFKMRDKQTGKYHALKCFLKEQEGRAEAYRMIAEELEYVNSTYLTPIRYLDGELFVDSGVTGETEFPVLLMDWIEGTTLDRYIRNNLHSPYTLGMLAYQFSRMAMWLVPQPFAHGDLKPDNILVKEDGTIVLVDYDGMYVPAMKGQRARELGSPDFRHPLRAEDDFHEHIDDFSLVSVLLSLKAISLHPDLLEEYGASDRLLFSADDYRHISQCRLLKELFPSDDSELNVLLSLFMLALGKTDLSQVSFRLLTLSRPQVPEIENLGTEFTDEDLANAWTDGYGVKYSADKKRLLKAPKELREYAIRKGTVVVCSSAFWHCSSLTSIIIPNSVTSIGVGAFYGCSSLTSITIPDSVTSIGEGTFSSCPALTSIVVDKNNKYYDSRNNCNAIIDKNNTLCIGCSTTIIPDSVTCIGGGAFLACSSLTSITIPNSVTSIESGAFCDCFSLTSITIPNSVTSIRVNAFWCCSSLTSITIPNSVTSIGDSAFRCCESLTFITIPDSVTSIGDSAFSGCSSLTSITIPESVTSIGKEVFYGCSSLTSITIPDSVTSIGNSAFSGCSSLTSIIIPDSVTSIGDSAFDGCSSLTSITIPNSVTSIGDSAFRCCESLTFITIPDSVTSIGDWAFDGCSSLTSITIPDSVTSIGDWAFDGCSFLTSIKIPIGTREKFEELLLGYKDILVEQ